MTLYDCVVVIAGVVAVVETRRGSSVSRSGVTPSFFKLGCHTKTLTMQTGFTPGNVYNNNFVVVPADMNLFVNTLVFCLLITPPLQLSVW